MRRNPTLKMVAPTSVPHLTTFPTINHQLRLRPCPASPAGLSTINSPNYQLRGDILVRASPSIRLFRVFRGQSIPSSIRPPRHDFLNRTPTIFGTEPVTVWSNGFGLASAPSLFMLAALRISALCGPFALRQGAAVATGRSPVASDYSPNESRA